MEGTAKKRGNNDVKWARNGLKKVGPMTDEPQTHRIGSRRQPAKHLQAGSHWEDVSGGAPPTATQLTDSAAGTVFITDYPIREMEMVSRVACTCPLSPLTRSLFDHRGSAQAERVDGVVQA